MPTVKMSGVEWRKSSRSGAQNACVEIGAARGAVAVRDSKDRSGPQLVLAPHEWASFVEGVKSRF